MLLIAFACLPPAVQTHVAAGLRAEVSTHAAAESDRPAADWAALLVSLNPVLSWHPVTQSLDLAAEGWAQLLQFTQPYLRPAQSAPQRALAAA